MTVQCLTKIVCDRCDEAQEVPTGMCKIDGWTTLEWSEVTNIEHIDLCKMCSVQLANWFALFKKEGGLP